MKYNELLNKCNEVAKNYNLDLIKEIETTDADSIRSKAAADVREWLQGLNVKPFDKSKRKYHFADRDEYLHTAFYETGIYIRKKVKTRKLHSVETETTATKKRKIERNPLVIGTDFETGAKAWAEFQKRATEAAKKREREEILEKIVNAKTTKKELIELLKKQIAL